MPTITVTDPFYSAYTGLQAEAALASTRGGLNGFVLTAATVAQGGAASNIQEVTPANLGLTNYASLSAPVSVAVGGFYLNSEGDPDGVFGGNRFHLVRDGGLSDNGGTIRKAAGGWDSSSGANDAFWVLQYSEAVNVKWFGAKGDSNGTVGNGTDDTAAIQLALDTGTYGLGCNRGTAIFFPAGKYRVTDTLFAGWPSTTGGYWSTRIIGEPSSRVSPKSTDQVTQSLIYGDFENAKKNRPIIAFENQRGSLFKYMACVGNMETTLDDLSYDDRMGIDLTDESNWIDATTAARTADQRRYTPWCSICFSGYSNSNVANGSFSYPSKTIPSYLTSIIGSTFGNGFPSANGTLEDFSVGQVDVGLVFAPNEGNNTDQYYLHKFLIRRCAYGVSHGHPNMRQHFLRDGYIERCYVGITDNTHGYQSGAFLGCTNTEIDYCFKAFKVNGKCILDRLYIENTVSIGDFNEFVEIDLHGAVSWDHYQNFQVPFLFCKTRVVFKNLNFTLIRTNEAVNTNARQYYDAPNIPWIYADSVHVREGLIFESRGPITTWNSANDSFTADIEDAAVTTEEQENIVIHAACHRVLTGFLVMPYNGTFADVQIDNMTLFTAGGNYTITNKRWSAGSGAAISGATYSHRKVVPYGVTEVFQTDTHKLVEVPRVAWSKIRPELDWDDITLTETTSAVTINGKSFTIRKVHADIVSAAPNSTQGAYKKGDIFCLRVSSSDTPQAFVIVQGPEDVVASGIQSEIHSGTAQAGATHTVTLDAGASGTDNIYNSKLIKITGGTGSGQKRHITGYNGTTKVANIEYSWDTTPDNTSTFQIIEAYAYRARMISGFNGNNALASGIPTYPSTTSYPSPIAYFHARRAVNPFRLDMFLNFTAGSTTVNIGQGGGGADIDATKLLRRDDQILVIDNDYLVGTTSFDQTQYGFIKVRNVVSASQFVITRNAYATGTARVLVF